MQQDDEFQSCPNADCPWSRYMLVVIVQETALTQAIGAFFSRDEGNIFDCQMCHLRWCLTCDVPFHSGHICEEYLAGNHLRGCQSCDAPFHSGETCEEHLVSRRLAAEQQGLEENGGSEEKIDLDEISVPKATIEPTLMNLVIGFVLLGLVTYVLLPAFPSSNTLKHMVDADLRKRVERERRVAVEASQRRQQEEREASQRRQQAEDASTKATRVCSSCHVKILKHYGCDHMTCKHHPSLHRAHTWLSS